jgi:hypothetical protein
VDYLKRQEMTGLSQIAHDLKIDLETCNILLLYLLRAGKIEKKGKDWNTAVFIVVR